MYRSRMSRAAEIRQRLGGITRQRVYQLTQRSDWPTPYDELVQGKVWRREDVEAWVEQHRPDHKGTEQ
jgi:prophage regulatory protein